MPTSGRRSRRHDGEAQHAGPVATLRDVLHQLEGTRERTRDGVDAIASQAERLVVSLLAAENYATL
jgi:hypothetical protein